MVAISFSVPKLREMILDGRKKQTIRLLNKKWQNVLDKWINYIEINLQLYWKQRTRECCLLKEVKLKGMTVIRLNQITEIIAIADGFESLGECLQWFPKTYRNIDFNSQDLVIVSWR